MTGVEPGPLLVSPEGPYEMSMHSQYETAAGTMATAAPLHANGVGDIGTKGGELPFAASRTNGSSWFQLASLNSAYSPRT